MNCVNPLCSSYKWLALGLLFSLGYSVRAQSCDGADGLFPPLSGNTVVANGDICANTAVVPYRWEITYTNVDDNSNPAAVEFFIDWDDGTNQTVVQGVGDNFVQNTAPNSYRAIVTHFFPANGGNVKCDYSPTVALQISGVLCASTVQTPSPVVRWNTDDENPGNQLLSEDLTNTVVYEICAGETQTIRFIDRSDFNCVPANFAGFPTNRRARWYQFIYGGDPINNTITGSSITIDPNTGSEPEPGAPITVTAGSSYSSLVTQRPIPVLGPTEFSFDITVPIDASAGEEFAITLNNWNECNKYRDAFGLTGNLPVQTTAIIRIITSPPAPLYTPQDYCVNDPINLTAIPSGGGTIKWYSNAALTNLVFTGITMDAVNDPPPAQQVDNTVAGSKNYYVTETLGNNCEGPPTTVTVNVFELPTVSDAGNDQSVCTPTAILNGNNPTTGVGMWNVVSGPGVVDNPALRNSTVSNLSDVTSTTARWTITNGPCTSQDFVVITRDPEPTISDAGTDQTLCNAASVVLSANVVTTGTGLWSQVGGPVANITNPTNRIALVNGLTGGNLYTFRWTISNGVCTPSIDDVDIQNDLLPAIDAGPDVSVCPPINIVFLQGVDPSPGTGTWLVTAGPGMVTNPNQFNSQVTNVTAQTDLTWTVVNGTCNGTDQVSITLDVAPDPSIPGLDDAVCADNYTFSGVNPVNGIGTWTVISGAGNFVDENSAVTTVNNMAEGANVYRWTVANACGSNANDISITNNLPTPSDAGTDIVICDSPVNLGGNNPTSLTGSWQEILGDGMGNFADMADPTTQFTGTAGVIYTLRWTITNGLCTDSEDEVIVQIDQNPDPALAGGDQIICGNNTNLTANIPVIGTGQWFVIAGDGMEVLGDINLGTSSFTGTRGVVYLLEWRISNGVCVTNTDQVIVRFDRDPTVSDAGNNQVLCGIITTLDGNNPTVGTGLWTEIAGDGNGNFANDTQFDTQFDGTAGVTYQLQWTISNGVCADSQDDVFIQFDQDPSIPLAGNDQVICGGTTNLEGNPILIGTGTWFITAGDGFGNVAIPNDPISQFTGTPGQIYTLEWRSSNGVCAVQTDEVIIQFDTPPSVSDPGIDQVVCGNSTILDATFPISGSGLWTFVSNPGGTGTIVMPTAINSTLNGNAGEIYELMWTVSNGVCPDETNTVIIQFDENPTTADAGNDKVVCISSTNLEANDPAVGTGVWAILSNPDGNGMITDMNQFDSPFTGSNGVDYVLRWSVSNGVCPVSQDDVTITIGPAIASPVISGTTEGCIGDILTFTVPGGNPAIYDYMWDLTNLPPTTQVIPGSGTPFHFISLEFFDPVVGDITVSIADKVTVCAGPSETAILTINNIPDMQLASDASPTFIICESDLVTFTATDLNGVADSYEFILNGSIVQSGISDTYSTILPSFNSMVVVGYSSICNSVPSAPITHVINSNPIKHFVNGGGDICQGDPGATISLNNSTAGVDYELFRDVVTTGEIITSTGGSFDFSLQTLPGTYSVEAVNINNCQIEMEGQPIVVVNPLPTAFTIAGGGSYCTGDPGLEITLDGSEIGINYELRRNALPTGNIVPGTAAALSFGFITEAGDYTVIAANTTTSCELLMNGIETISITPLPVVTPLLNTPVICSGDLVDIVITSDLGGSTFTWTASASSGNVSGMNDQLLVPAAEGVVINDMITNTDVDPQTVTYEIFPENTCSGLPVIVEILVNPTPSITILQDQTVCEGAATQITFESTGQIPFDIVYNDGTSDFTIQNVGNSHTIIVNPTVTTTYSVVSVTDGNGCIFNPVGEEAIISIETVNADFSTIQPTESCSPYEVTFQNNDIQPGIEYTWSWGDGTIDEVSDAPTISHTFVNNSTSISLTYNVTLTARNSSVNPACVASQILPITLLPTVNINLSPSIEEGCSPVSISITNNSIGASSHNWYYRVQGTNDVINVRNTPDVNYILTNTTTGPLIYEVVYEGTNGLCTVTEITEVTVYPEVNATFTVNGSVAPAPADLATTPHALINNTSISVPTWSYDWDYGDGNTSLGEQPTSPYTYSLFGNFNILLTVTEPDGGCTDTEAILLRVEPAFPVIDFTATPISGCRPLEVAFTNNSFSVDPSSFLWEFYSGTGALLSTSTELNPTFIFNNPGFYSVRLSGDNSAGTGAEEFKQNFIEVFGLPTASFQIRPDVVFLPDGILYTQNTSFNAADFEWDFGDGTSSNDFQPEHTYSQTGTYTIELIARNSQGCSDTTMLENAVQVIDGGTLRVPNAFTPNLNGPSGGVAGGGTFNDVFLPIVDGVEKFNMQVFDRWGNVIFETTNKEIGWDGYDKFGKLLPTGVYVYKLQMQFSNKEKFEQIGDVTLIR